MNKTQLRILAEIAAHGETIVSTNRERDMMAVNDLHCNNIVYISERSAENEYIIVKFGRKPLVFN